MSRFHLYATRSDWCHILDTIENEFDIKCTLLGHIHSQPPEYLPSLSDMQPLGNSESPLCRIYLIMPTDSTPRIRAINRKTETVYAVEPNDETITVRMGGFFDAETLIAGEIVSDTKGWPANATKSINTVFKKHFTKEQIYYLGPEAFEFWKKGGRLTTDAQTPPEYDLKYPPADASVDTVRTERLDYQASCLLLQKQGFLEADCAIPAMPKTMPTPHDEELGFSIFRTFLSETDFRYLTLPRTFINRSEVAKTSFQHSILDESFLCWNDFIDVDFSHASLIGADLRATHYLRVNFDYADLSGADLRGTLFEECSFKETVFRGSILNPIQAEPIELTEQQKSEISWSDDYGSEPEGG